MYLLLNALKSGFSFTGYPTTYEEIVNKDGTTTINAQLNGNKISITLQPTDSKADVDISTKIAAALKVENDKKDPGKLPPPPPKTAEVVNG